MNTANTYIVPSFLDLTSCVQTGNWCITAPMVSNNPDAFNPDDVDTTVPHWERACIAQMDQGNPEAFNPLVHYYSKRIYAHLYRMTHNKEEAEDLTQEAFVLAYRKIKSYDRTRPFRNWLYTIATNVARNAARSRGRRIPSAREEARTEETVVDHRFTHTHESRELKQQLSMAISGLPDPLPVLFQLYYQEGFTLREAAQVLGMSESAAKVALHRARKTLRTLLEKEEL